MVSKRTRKIKTIIEKIKQGYPYKIAPASFEDKEIGCYCYYWSEANKCFQQGIHCYEANAMLLDDEPERITEEEIFKKIKDCLEVKKDG